MIQPKTIQKALKSNQSLLESIPGYLKGKTSDNTWKFRNTHDKEITINFDDIKTISARHKNKTISKRYDLTAITKLIWLSEISSSTTAIDAYVTRCTGIKLVFEALATINSLEINLDNIESILNFLLTHTLNDGRIERKPEIVSYSTFIIRSNLTMIQQAMIDNELHFISHRINKSTLQKSLEKTIPSITKNQLTYSDWATGKSLDLLTLDNGRYYIEHCLTYFENNYALAIALSKVIKDTNDIASTLNLKPSTTSQPLTLIMRGYLPEEIKSIWGSWPKESTKKIYNEAITRFNKYYKRALLESHLLNEKNIDLILNEIEIEPTKENNDRLKVICWTILSNKDGTIKLANHPPKFPIREIKRHIKLISKRIDEKEYKFPTDSEYLSYGLSKKKHTNSNSTYPRQLINLVQSSGITSIVALTGWRKSEFGFPISASVQSDNLDKLDRYAFPYRYHVNWYIYKTNGKSKSNREITFNIITIVHRMTELNHSGEDLPCVYETNPTNRNPHNSQVAIQKHVRRMWPHFVTNYQGFTRASIKSQSPKNDEYADPHLEITKKRVRTELPRVEFFLRNSKGDKKNWLIRYKTGELRKDWTDLLDQHLPEETKVWIESRSEKELKSATASNYVSGRLVDGCIYPSAHAFRHMWAEAVYRRFDGDAGWMIRSQFKHISSTMWLSYIRDKDNRWNHQQVQQKVVSSLVNNYLLRKGKGYSGQLNTWLRRLSRKTSIHSLEEQSSLAEHLATTEIISIKSNPWGYCLLRKRSQSKAQCAIDGEPHRYNASPDLCLNCTHNLMQTNNIDWSIFHASQHVEALHNPDIPEIFQESSYKLVKNVYQHTKMLDPCHKALSELQEAMECYKNRKLKNGS